MTEQHTYPDTAELADRLDRLASALNVGKNLEVWVASSDHALIREATTALRSRAALKARIEELTAALREIAEHPESKQATRADEPSHGFGWAFWNVQHIARAALSKGAP